MAPGRRGREHADHDEDRDAERPFVATTRAPGGHGRPAHGGGVAAERGQEAAPVIRGERQDRQQEADLQRAAARRSASRAATGRRPPGSTCSRPRSAPGRPSRRGPASRSGGWRGRRTGRLSAPSSREAAQQERQSGQCAEPRARRDQMRGVGERGGEAHRAPPRRHARPTRAPRRRQPRSATAWPRNAAQSATDSSRSRKRTSAARSSRRPWRTSHTVPNWVSVATRSQLRDVDGRRRAARHVGGLVRERRRAPAEASTTSRRVHPARRALPLARGRPVGAAGERRVAKVPTRRSAGRRWAQRMTTAPPRSRGARGGRMVKGTVDSTMWPSTERTRKRTTYFPGGRVAGTVRSSRRGSWGSPPRRRSSTWAPASLQTDTVEYAGSRRSLNQSWTRSGGRERVTRAGRHRFHEERMRACGRRRRRIRGSPAASAATTASAGPCLCAVTRPTAPRGRPFE